ncbi:MAG: hypothetical protein GWO16_04395 [Gammaproteobacteria bacterium]|nr:hypothetical protein [Gammaproteobacteria bacterium]
MQEYAAVRKPVQDSPFDEALWVRSETEGHRLSADVYSEMDYPFSVLIDAVGTPANWCRFIPLNLNVKSCVYDDREEPVRLAIYVGRKYYEEPEDAYRMEYRYRVEERTPDYLRVALVADEGPLGTRDHGIVAEVARLGQKSLVHVRSRYRSSWRSRIATSIYLSTLGSDKIGFSVVGTDDAGELEFVKGVNGIVERNAMRYYFTLEAFLATLEEPANQRFEQRIQTWFDLTERYARQLHELKRGEYLEAKRRERGNQVRLQAAVSGPREAVAEH